MPEREHARREVVFASELYFDDQDMPCSIINISVGGAKLKISGKYQNEYPRTAVLDISPFGRFPVTIVWHSGEHLGAKFQDGPDVMAEVLMAMAVY